MVFRDCEILSDFHHQRVVLSDVLRTGFDRTQNFDSQFFVVEIEQFAQALFKGLADFVELFLVLDGAKVCVAVVVFLRVKWKKLNPVWPLVASAVLGWALFL